MDIDISDQPPHRPEYCSHSSREQTFKSKKTTPKALRWPHPDSFPLSPTILASAGYFHDPVESEPDRTTCWMCGDSTKSWDATDDPWAVHLEWSPNCPFSRLAILDRQRDTQIPAWPDVFNQPWGPTAEWFPRGKVMIEARLATFCGKSGQWRHEGEEGLPTRIELARAGFHFAPNLFKKGRKLEVDDTTSCCYCRRTVSEWEAGDDPVSIHLKKGSCIFFSATPPTEPKTKPKLESSRKASTAASRKATGRKPARIAQADESIEEPDAAPTLAQSSKAPKKPTAALNASGKSSRPGRRGPVSATASPTREQSPVGQRESSPALSTSRQRLTRAAHKPSSPIRESSPAVQRDSSPAPAPSRQRLPRGTHKPPSAHVPTSPDVIEPPSKPPVSLPQATRVSRSTSRAPSIASNSRGAKNQMSASTSRTKTRCPSPVASGLKPSTSIDALPDVNEGQNADASIATKPKTRKTKAEKLAASTSGPADLDKPIVLRPRRSSNLHLEEEESHSDHPEDLSQAPASRVITKLPKTRKIASTKRQKSATPNLQSPQPKVEPTVTAHLSSVNQPPNDEPHQPSEISLQQVQPGHSTGYNPQAPQLYSGILPVASKSMRSSTKPSQKSPSAPTPTNAPPTVDDLLDEYLDSNAKAPLPEGFLPNPYNPSKPYPPLSAEEAEMRLDDYFAYRADQEEAEFLAWVEERKMRPWLKKVEEGRQMIDELIRTSSGSSGGLAKKKLKNHELRGDKWKVGGS